MRLCVWGYCSCRCWVQSLTSQKPCRLSCMIDSILKGLKHFHSAAFEIDLLLNIFLSPSFAGRLVLYGLLPLQRLGNKESRWTSMFYFWSN